LSDVGPQPLPAAAYSSLTGGKSGMEEFLEREERRRKLQKEASKPKEASMEGVDACTSQKRQLIGVYVSFKMQLSKLCLIKVI
jgi:hypothetical protein